MTNGHGSNFMMNKLLCFSSPWNVSLSKIKGKVGKERHIYYTVFKIDVLLYEYIKYIKNRLEG